jgi:ribonucleoside-diphosphate reductase alpha chain
MTYSKNYWLNEESRTFLNRGYITETPEERIKHIAYTAEKILKIDGFADKFEDYMQKGYYSLSTPVWTNFGKNKGLPISCYGSNVDDSLDSILNAAREIGLMSKYGGGTSIYLGNIRPRGTFISTGGQADGPVHYSKIYDTVIDTCKQGESRRGACALWLPIEHKDIEEFLEIGSDGNPIQNLQFGVTISDKWMEEMKSGDSSKRKVWAKVIQKRSEFGFPYIMFRDNTNNNTPYKELGLEITASNLCVAPNTQILTEHGYFPIADLENEEVKVWNGKQWSNTIVKKTGENQKLLRVVTTAGYELDCTAYHKFYVQEKYSRSKIIEKRACELKPGDKLIKFDLPLIEGEKELDNAYVNGFYSGDGCLTPEGQRIYLYHEKRNLVHKFDIILNWTNQPEFKRMYGHTKTLKDKFFVPDASYTIKSRIEWLAGYIDADGTITDDNGSQTIQIASVEKEFLKEIQLMLQTLGVDSKVTLNRVEGKFMLPANDGTGQLKEYNCKEVNRLLINGNSLFKLSQLGLVCERVKWIIKKPNRECAQFIKIQSVEELPNLSDTYCFNEPIEHKGMFNGILTGQCSEIQLPTNSYESFVCCIGSINLLHWDKIENSDAIEIYTLFLNAVLDEFIVKSSILPGMKRAHRFAKNHRAIGVGVLGYHSLLQSKLIEFDSLQAKQYNYKIFKILKERTESASKELYQKGITCIREGYANTTLVAIAPTKSSSFILGQVSMGIEPIKSNYFVKDLAKIKTVYRNPFLLQELEKYNLNTSEVWENILKHDGSVQHLDFPTKKVFKTFLEISPKEIILQAAQRQKFIDQAQSLNLMLHPSIPAKDINQLYLYAWEEGVKTLYYQFSQSSAQSFVRNVLECSSCE